MLNEIFTGNLLRNYKEQYFISHGTSCITVCLFLTYFRRYNFNLRFLYEVSIKSSVFIKLEMDRYFKYYFYDLGALNFKIKRYLSK